MAYLNCLDKSSGSYFILIWNKNMQCISQWTCQVAGMLLQCNLQDLVGGFKAGQNGIRHVQLCAQKGSFGAAELAYI